MASSIERLSEHDSGEQQQQVLIPGLPDDIAVLCLVRVPRRYHAKSRCVSRGWKSFIGSSSFLHLRKSLGLAEGWLYALIVNAWTFQLGVYAMDPQARKWLQLPAMPLQVSTYLGHRWSATCGTLGRRLYVFGSKPMLLCYDATTNAWSTAPPLQFPEYNPVTASVDGKLYAICGVQRSSFEVLDSDEGEWTMHHPMYHGDLRYPSLWESEALVLGHKIYFDWDFFLDTSDGTIHNKAQTQGWSMPSLVAEVRGKVYIMDYSIRECLFELMVIEDFHAREWSSVGKLQPEWTRPRRIAGIGRELFIVANELHALVVNLDEPCNDQGFLLTSPVEGLGLHHELAKLSIIELMVGSREEQDELARTIKSCPGLVEARRVHGTVASGRHSGNVYLTNLLIEMYGKCGSVLEADRLFRSLPRPNFFSWSILLVAYAHNGALDRAAATLAAMPASDILSWTALLAGYGKSGRINEAKVTFDRMPGRNDVSWNTMLTTLVHCGRIPEAASVFDKMPFWGTLAWHAMLTGHSHSGTPNDAKLLFDRTPARDFMSWTTLFQCFARWRDLIGAKLVFDRMAHWDVVSWTSMLTAYVAAADVQSAERIFEDMLHRDTVAWNAMLAAYAQAGDISKAKNLFEDMPSRNVASWTTMCSGLARHGFVEDAVEMLVKMPSRDLYTCNGMIAALARQRYLSHAKSLFDETPDKNVIAWTAMVAAYAQNGCVDEAKSLFDAMEYRDVVAWNAMLDAYARSRDELGVMQMLWLMVVEGDIPNDASFVSVLSAFSEAGEIGHALACFQSMVLDYGVSPIKDHFNLILAILCKAGELEDALELICYMPFFPDDVAWGSLLSSCKHHRDLVLASVAARSLFSTSCSTNGSWSAPYALLASICEWDDEQVNGLGEQL